MSESITYAGIETHARELHVALLGGDATTPMTWDTTAMEGTSGWLVARAADSVVLLRSRRRSGTA